MSGLTKIIRFDDQSPSGEPTMRIINPDDFKGVKLASEAAEYIRDIKPKEGKTIVLVLAMSAGEFYGPNRNGDAFSEGVVPGMVEKGQSLKDHFKTFETSAHIFKNHVNKDPKKSIGDIKKAFYNDEMHRVELLLELDNEKAADIIEKINSGLYPAVSMGCRIKFDICNICGNKAPTRAEYCDHAKYEMNRIYPDGRQSFVWNPSPQLFDISFVIRPADRIGFMMKKVASAAEDITLSAELGEKLADVQEKQSTLRKLSIMDKQVRGQIVDHEPKNKPQEMFRDEMLPGIMQNSPGFDDETISTLAKHPLPNSLSTMSAMGIVPTGGEILRIMVQRSMPGTKVPESMLDNMSSASGGILEILSQHPEIMEAVLGSGLLDIGPEKVNPVLGHKLSAWMEKRSNFKEYLLRRAQPYLGEAHPDIGNWDPINVTDPATGTPYQTTRGAVDKADDANVERQMKVLGGGALLAGGAYKALTSAPGGKYMAPLLAAGSALGLHGLKRLTDVPTLNAEGPSQPADKLTGLRWGNTVPINTEMRKAGSLSVPLASSAAMTALLAQEYNKRSDENSLGNKESLVQKLIEGLGLVAARHPAAMLLAGMAGVASLEAVGQSILEQFVKHATDENGMDTSEVDLDGLCSWLGEGLA